MSDNMRTGVTLAALAGVAVLGYFLLAPKPAQAQPLSPSNPNTGDAGVETPAPPAFGIGVDPCRYFPDSAPCKKWF